MEAADGGEGLYVLEAPMLNETGKPLVYPFDFEPTLHRYRMDIPGKLKMGNNIFVGAMSDIFGEWVPDEWIKEIFAVCIKNPIHNYLFLTKNPKRYERIDAIGILPANKNLWYGSTLTKPEDKCFISNVHNTFWSIEPIHAPFQLGGKDEFLPNWIIIGAETGRRKDKVIPKKAWIDDIVAWCKKAEIPIFMKDSLLPIMGEENMCRELPIQLQQSELSTKMKKKLYDICSGCKMDLKKSDMIALLARSMRGEQPKQFWFLCEGCFKELCKNLGLNVPQLERFTDNITIESISGGKIENENPEIRVGTEDKQN